MPARHAHSDLELFAARIRPHFEPELRDTAYELALDIARVAGAEVKQLRPGTTVAEILEWLDWLGKSASPADSLDEVDWLLMLAETLGLELADESASQLELKTFRDLVILRARQRAA